METHESIARDKYMKYNGISVQFCITHILLESLMAVLANLFPYTLPPLPDTLPHSLTLTPIPQYNLKEYFNYR